MRKPKSKWICKPDCESCEGRGYVVSGMGGFVNSRMEQDCRDVYESCENAELYEPDYDRIYDEKIARRLMEGR